MRVDKDNTINIFCNIINLDQVAEPETAHQATSLLTQTHLYHIAPTVHQLPYGITSPVSN